MTGAVRECLKGRCLSPVACGGFGHCREFYMTDRTNDQAEKVKLTIQLSEEESFAIKEVLRITDRQHVAWDKAKAAMENQTPSNIDQILQRECDDADELIRLLGLDPDACRTDGGAINLPKIRSLLGDK